MRASGNTDALLNYPICDPSLKCIANSTFLFIICGGLSLLLYPTIYSTMDMPYPISMLKTGPAIVAVIAISPNPFRVIATSADMSPRQLPQARKESDRSA